MKIVVLVDPEMLPADDPMLEGKTKEVRQQTEYHVTDSLRQNGHEALPMAFDPDVVETIRQLRLAGPDLVFNLTEHFGGDRRKDVHIAAILDMLDLPFTGTGTTGLMLCRDKGLCKRLLSHHRIRVPDFAELPLGQIKLPRRLSFPLIVKPLWEDGSDGISMASLVRNEEELRERAQSIHERMKQPVICEEYVEGREIYVSVVGNEKLRALPARELKFGGTGEGAPTFATAKVKRDQAYRKKWDIRYEHAGLPREAEAKAARFSKRIYRLLQIRDYGRVDYRLTENGEIVFLEANANPDLSLEDELAESWAKAGKTYRELIGSIVSQARQRFAQQ